MNFVVVVVQQKQPMHFNASQKYERGWVEVVAVATVDAAWLANNSRRV